MKKIIILLLFFVPVMCFSQQVIFCEQVDALGTPTGKAEEFSIGSKGGFFKILVKLKHEIESKNVVFDVYLMKEEKESFHTSLRMDVKPGLTWFYKEITFFKPGEYHVYVYDGKDQLLGAGKVKIKLR
jgi:hypothetical protein